MLATQCIMACRHGQDNLKKFKRSIRTGKKRNQKLLVYWDFPTQLSLGFTENGAKKKKKRRKYPVCGYSLGENALLDVREERAA